ncbi:tRNA pseudouridine(38-40) synthase TruA [Halobacteriovorax marinus]|uniref:tRNA pseudouridine synthase A n=1 Tax=Halobacteriovorax marinus TaxID=97084 RepID=A0A1Y5FCJ7_9BACT|nr:tRNA pseudouridine(38-40) synthase TruA [Halobacteriovorax marinus]
MKRFYNLEVHYKGQNYFGWQKQKDFKTIQGTLETTLKDLVGSDSIRTMGSSRTDTGVHSLANVCFVQIPCEFTPQQLKEKLNQLLPDEIHIERCERTYSHFKVIYFAKSKQYIYLFKNLPEDIESNYFTNIPEKLNIEKMKEATKSFIGVHDFTNFSYKPSKNAEKVREIFKCEIVESQDYIKGEDREDCYALVIEGSGFLKQMVRIIMGTLFNIGHGKVEIEDIEVSYDSSVFHKTGFITPGAGLYLNHIDFIRDPFKGHKVQE